MRHLGLRLEGNGREAAMGRPRTCLVPGGKQDQGLARFRCGNLATVFQLEPAVVRIGFPGGRMTECSGVGGC